MKIISIRDVNNRSISTFEYLNQDTSIEEFKTMVGIRDDMDTFILNKLVEYDIVSLDADRFEKCNGNNPVLEQYKHWEKNWRNDSTKDAYTWRKNSEKFFSLNGNETKGQLKDYINYLHTFNIVST